MLHKFTHRLHIKWHDFWWLPRIGTNRALKYKSYWPPSHEIWINLSYHFIDENITSSDHVSWNIYTITFRTSRTHDIQIPSNQCTVHHLNQRRRSSARIRKRINKETFNSSTPRLRRYEQTHDRFVELYNSLELQPSQMSDPKFLSIRIERNYFSNIRYS